MRYNRPALTLVGSAQSLVLDLSESLKPAGPCVQNDPIGLFYQIDETGW